MSEIRRKSKYIEAGSFMEKEHVITDEPLVKRIAELEVNNTLLEGTLSEFIQICPDQHPYLFATADLALIGMDCPACEAKELQAQVDALNAPVLKSEWQQQQDHISELEECLKKAITLMDDVRSGDYVPDSFTTQPWRQALQEKP